MTLDMTRGNPGRLLLKFAVPLMLSSLLQQMYNLCDTFIVGRFLGAVALTATGSAGNLHWIPVNLVNMAIYAYGVALSQSFGAGDRERFRSFAAWSGVLTVFWSLVITLVGLTFAEDFLRLLSTPEELMPQTIAYLRIIWAAFLTCALLTLTNTILMSMGDSRTPLVSLAISSVLNIVLDVWFLAGFRMGVEGAALATVVAQLAAIGWNLWVLRSREEAHVKPVHFRFRPWILKELLRLSIPQMLCSVVINSGDLLVQSAINGWGVAFVMGVNASRRYFSMLNIVGYGLEGAVSTYVGQNWGAGKLDRIRSGTRFSAILGFASSAAIGAAVCLAASPMISFLLKDGSPESIRVGVDALRMLALFLPGLYLLCEFRAAIQGMGNVVFPMLSGFSELIMRVAAVFALPVLLGREGLYFVDPCAWVPTMLLMVVGYLYVLRRRKPVIQK